MLQATRPDHMKCGVLALLLATMVASAAGCQDSTVPVPGGPSTAPVLSQITPATASVGDTVTLTGTGFTPSTNAVKIGIGYLNGIAAFSSTSFTFTVPAALTPCPPGTQVCVALAIVLTPGSYQVSVMNANGMSNERSLQVVAK